MKPLLALLPVVLAFPVAGQPVLSLPLPGDAHVVTVAHSCSDGIARQVSYVTLGHDSLAIFGGHGGPLIFVQVIAASGARYVAGTQEWWAKSDNATFRDATNEDGGMITCQAMD